MLSLEERLAELRATFMANSRRKLGEIDGLLQTLELDPSDSEAAWNVYRLFHGFAGIGKTYGFPEISEVGSEGERIADALVKAGESTTEQLTLLRGAARRIATELQEDVQEHVRLAEDEDRPRVPLAMLIVSSDDALLQTIGVLARREAFEPKVARTIDEARRIMAEGVPAALFVDVDVDAEPAYSMIEHLRMLPDGESCFAAVTSSGGGFIDNVQAIRCGADQFLPKPIDADALLRRLRRIHEHLQAAAPRVLSVEDDPDQAAYITSILETAGYQVRVCDHPSRFEEALSEFRPDLVLMDIVLPGGVSGHELVRYIRQRDEYAPLPVIFLTTENRVEGMIASIRAGGDDHLVKPIAASLLVSSVATRIERARVLRGLLLRDGLTGLLTHSAFSERLRLAVAERQRHAPSALALVMIDVDHFKTVNDTYGHPVGDKVLASLAALLRRRLRRSDSIARYGGEEFAFLLPDIQEADAVRIVRALLDDFSSTEQAAPGGAPFRVTFSAGLSMLRPADDVETWKSRADSALYAAKRAGRACVVAE